MVKLLVNGRGGIGLASVPPQVGIDLSDKVNEGLPLPGGVQPRNEAA